MALAEAEVAAAPQPPDPAEQQRVLEQQRSRNEQLRATRAKMDEGAEALASEQAKLSSGEAEYYALLKGSSQGAGCQAMCDDLDIFLSLTSVSIRRLPPGL